MNIQAMVDLLSVRVEELKKDQQAYLTEKEAITKRLQELDNLLGPIKTDIDGFELAIEGLKSTSDISGKVDEKPAAITAVHVTVGNTENSLEKYPAKKVSKNKLRPGSAVIRRNHRDEFIARYPSINEASRDLKWTWHKVRNAIKMTKAVQINKYGFYLSYGSLPKN